MAVKLSDLNANPSQAAASAAETLIVDELPSDATSSLEFNQFVTIIIALRTVPCTGSRDHPDVNALRRLIRRAPKLEKLRIIQRSAPESPEKTFDRSLLGGDRPNVDIKYIPAHDLTAAFARSPQVSPAKAAVESWAATVASACEVWPRSPLVEASMEPPDTALATRKRVGTRCLGLRSQHLSFDGSGETIRADWLTDGHPRHPYGDRACLGSTEPALKVDWRLHSHRDEGCILEMFCLCSSIRRQLISGRLKELNTRKR